MRYNEKLGEVSQLLLEMHTLQQMRIPEVIMGYKSLMGYAGLMSDKINQFSIEFLNVLESFVYNPIADYQQTLDLKIATMIRELIEEDVSQ